MKNSLKDLLDRKDQLAILWEGNDGWLIHHEDKLIAFDLDIYNPERITKSTLDINLLCKHLDVHFISHEHEDHFNSETCRLLNNNSNCMFIIPKSCEEKARELGIQENRMQIVQPNDTYSTDWLFVKCIRAIHGHIDGAVYSGANMYDCGYVVEFGNKIIYQPGDTILLEEHSELKNIDILFVSTTDHNTKVDNSLKMINAIKPCYIFPQHYNTYVEHEDNIFWTHGYVDELYDKLTEIYKKRFIKLSYSDVWRSRD